MLMTMGMICLLLSSLPTFIHIVTTVNADAVDFARGLMLGLSIGLNLVAVWMLGRNRRCVR